MSEIIYAETEEHRDALDRVASGLTGKVFLDRKLTVWQSDRKVSVAQSVMSSGVPRTAPDKRWYRWGTYEAFGFYRTSTGLAQPFQCVRDINVRAGTKWVNIVPDKAIGLLGPVEEPSELGDVFRRAMWETFRMKNFYDLYPLAEQWEIEKYSAMPGNIRKAFRNKTMDDFASEVFGKKRRTRSLINAVANTDPYIIAVANDFRGHASDSAIIQFMGEKCFDDEMEEGFAPHTPSLRNRILNHLDRNTCNSLLNNEFDLDDTRRIATLSRVNTKHWDLPKILAGRSIGSFQELSDTVYNRNLPHTFP